MLSREEAREKYARNWKEGGREEWKESNHRNSGLFAVELLAATTRRVDNNSELSATRGFRVGELTPRFVTNENRKHPLERPRRV